LEVFGALARRIAPVAGEPWRAGWCGAPDRTRRLPHGAGAALLAKAGKAGDTKAAAGRRVAAWVNAERIEGMNAEAAKYKAKVERAKARVIRYTVRSPSGRSAARNSAPRMLCARLAGSGAPQENPFAETLGTP